MSCMVARNDNNMCAFGRISLVLGAAELAGLICVRRITGVLRLWNAAK